MLGNRQSQHSFAQIPAVHMARSSFNRSHTVKDTFDFDYLVPIFVDEVIPGDTMNLNTSVFARLATQKVPIMDNMYVDYFFFFVPNRLVFDNWEKLCGAQDNPGDSTDFVLPTLTAPGTGGGFAVGTIYDKMGLPTGVNSVVVNNSLPLRCYNLIWNQWFRDQNLQDSVVVPKDNGPDAPGDFTLLKRGRRHDYFTSCLPWPQKGPDVTLPLGSRANIAFDGATGTGNILGAYSTTDMIHRSLGAATSSGDLLVAFPGTTPTHELYADLSDASAATINQLREAFMMQSLFELDARGGTRYVEILQAHYNVTSPDFRLQRPEFLGGGSSRINVHPVPQTAPTSGSNPQAQLASFATTSGSGIGFTKSFVEHGYVLGLACARADITYQQGINRLWNRSTRFDFFWPKLQELGEQAVLNKEIYAQGTADDELVFGYQERFAEYRYKPSEIRGEFRSTFATSLDYWHMAEEFGSLPLLNDIFIEQNTPVDRAIAVPSEPHLLFDCWFQLTHARPMMTYSVPASLGRF